VIKPALTGRLRGWSLRRRLVALLVLLLLVACAVIAAVTTLSMRGFLLQRLDEQLVAAGNRYAVSLERRADGEAPGFDAVVGQPPGTLGARVSGGVVTAIGVVGDDDRDGDSDRAGAPTAADRAALARLPVTARPRTVGLPSLGDYRIIVRPGADGDLLITGLPEHPVEETIARLAVIEVIVFGGVLVGIGIAGALLVRWSLRPLRRVAGTALSVSALPLGSGQVRLPEPVPNPQPDTEVGQLTEAFNHMLEHVGSALAQRHASEERLRRFLADASHELRTPVAVVRSHAEYAERAGGELPEHVARALTRIGAESARMGRMVDDLLLLARLASGRPLADEPVDLTRVVLDAVTDARVAGADHRWQLELPDEPVTVRGDAHALHQALANLLANARLHTPPGTTVTVALRARPDGVELDVRDDGPGIPPQVMARLFERFVHGTAPGPDAPASTGLGLAIVAAIAHAHRGSVHVEPGPGGTVFSIRLPVEPDGTVHRD
jgi:two-component system OmpR family sensor kinase